MKKILLTTFAASALLLTGCSSSKEIASTKEGKIREDDLYEAMKNEPLQGGLTVGETVLQKILIEQIFEYNYGDKVSDDEIDAEFEETAEQFGGVEEYETILEQQGIDPSFIKENMRLTLLINEAIKDKKEFSDEDLEEMYEELKPEATVQHVLVDDEETANDIIDQLEDGADFGEIVAEHSTDPGSEETEGVYSFQQGEMVPEFEEAALALEEGETTSEPVESDYGYHVIRRLELDYAPLEEQKEELKDTLVEQYSQDDTFMTELIAELAEAANVKISDDELVGAMQGYLSNGEEEDSPEDEDLDLPVENDETEDDVEEESESEDEEETEE